MPIDPFVKWEANDQITHKNEEYAHPCVIKDLSAEQSTNDSKQRRGDNDDDRYPRVNRDRMEHLPTFGTAIISQRCRPISPPRNGKSRLAMGAN
jgi:hypothetical protein